jgi:hypothetical protein
MYGTDMWGLGGGWKEIDKIHSRFCKTILGVPRFAADSVSEQEIDRNSPGVDSASKRNEYQESSWGVKGGQRIGMTTSPPSVRRLSKQNVGASTSHNPMGLHGLLQGYLFTLFIVGKENAGYVITRGLSGKNNGK